MAKKISRRGFIKAAAAAAAAPALSKIQTNNPPKRPIIGHGEHTYEVYHDWVQPPQNVLWGDTHGLALDSHGRIYIAHTVHPSSVGSDAVAVYDQKGRLLDSWGAEFRGGAHGLDLRKEGNEQFLYHCDIRRRLVVKTDLNGKVVWERGYPKESGVYPSEDRYCPTNVAFHPDGDLFVGDGYGSSYIHRFTKDGPYVSTIVPPGSEAGEVSCPHGLWVDQRGKQPKLIVADRGNRRIQYFTLEGQHLSFLTEGMRMPCHIHFQKNLMLVPDLESVVTILDKDDKVIASLGDGHPSNLRGAPREQFIPGKFIHPHAAIWINKRDIVVVEWVPIGRVTLLKKVEA